jgi:hypothetical protein
MPVQPVGGVPQHAEQLEMVWPLLSSLAREIEPRQDKFDHNLVVVE